MTHNRVASVLFISIVGALASACGGASPPPAHVPTAAAGPTASAPAPGPSTAPPAAPPVAAAGNATPSVNAAPKPPLDATRVGAVTGGKPEVSDNVVKVSFPRDDVKVDVDGWNKMPPFMGLTSWAGFVPAEKPGVEAMVMGDLVLFEDEVNPAMSAALDNGLEVTALHNHFFFDKPHVLFMHIGGGGASSSSVRE